MKITGKVCYQDIGMGFWGIIDKAGNEWRPINMPEQLKHEGATVSIEAEEIDGMSIVMWGKEVRINSFTTISLGT